MAYLNKYKRKHNSDGKYCKRLLNRHATNPVVPAVYLFLFYQTILTVHVTITSNAHQQTAPILSNLHNAYEYSTRNQQSGLKFLQDIDNGNYVSSILAYNVDIFQCSTHADNLLYISVSISNEDSSTHYSSNDKFVTCKSKHTCMNIINFI